MANSKRVLASALAVVIVASLPLAAAASERDAIDRPVTDRPVTDRPDTDRQLTDRPIVDVTDRRPDVIDRRRDVTDHRCCVHLVDHPRRCADGGLDDPHYVRHLIWRLVQAHEWKKLVRLLHALGWL